MRRTAPVTCDSAVVTLDVRYTPPAFRALSGCLAQRPGCALVKTEAASKLVVTERCTRPPPVSTSPTACCPRPW